MKKLINLIFLSMIIMFLWFGVSYDGKLIKIYGFSVAVVSSGSMMPELDIGDIIIMKECKSYNEGDIITFNSNNEYLVTHRIIERKGYTFVTKGDNNNTIDTQNVLKDDIEGKVILNSKLFKWLYNHWLFFIVLIILILILL